MKSFHNKKAFASLVEITVTAILFSITALGILSTISILQNDSVASLKKLKALYVAQNFIQDLYNEIDASSWDANGSALEPDVNHPINYTAADGTVYTINYTLTDVAGLDLRKLALRITYPD